MMAAISSGGDISTGFNKEQLGQLYTKATHFNNTVTTYTNNCFARPIKWFYRNQAPTYFSKYTSMQVHLKDNNGDPKNPTNGRLAGLFFCANVFFPTGLPPSDSPFGPRRVKVPTQHMFHQGTNLYFADFYCMNGADRHYVMLVMCRAGSDSDMYCAQHLFPLDKFNNDFLTLDQAQQAYIKNHAKLWVEVFYTEDIDLRNTPGLEWEDCAHNGHYPQYPGIPKTANCDICIL